MAAAIEKEVSKRLTISTVEAPAATVAPTDDEARAYIMSLMKVKATPLPAIVGAATGSTQLVKRVTLQSILAKAKYPPQG
jgi:hypothetical protein